VRAQRPARQRPAWLPAPQYPWARLQVPRYPWAWQRSAGIRWRRGRVLSESRHGNGERGCQNQSLHPILPQGPPPMMANLAMVVASDTFGQRRQYHWRNDRIRGVNRARRLVASKAPRSRKTRENRPARRPTGARPAQATAIRVTRRPSAPACGRGRNHRRWSSARRSGPPHRARA